MASEKRSAEFASRRRRPTEIFRHLGTLWCAGELEKNGVKFPSQQMMATIRFVIVHLTEEKQLPATRDRGELREWASSLLRELAARFRTDNSLLKAWRSDALRSTARVAWDPLAEFGELLQLSCGAIAFSGAARQLQRQGFDISNDMVFDLTDQFSRQRLNRALHSFDPQRGVGKEGRWLTQVFYRFALQELISDRANRRHLAFFQPRSQSPNQVVEREHENNLLESLPSVVANLSKEQRTSVTLYFGLDNREHTIGEIAKTLDLSEYKVRLILVRTLAELATRLKVSSRLDETEHKFLHCMLVEGMPPERAAVRLDVSRPSIQKSIDDKFAAALRARTSVPVLISGHKPGEESTMTPNTTDTLPALDPQAYEEHVKALLIKHLESGSGRPHIRADDPTDWVVELSNERISYGLLRQCIARDTKLLNVMKNRDALGWFAPSGPGSERADVLEDAGLTGDELRRLRDRQWQRAEEVYRQCEEGGSVGEQLFAEEPDHTVERIYLTLIGISQSIVAELTATMRRRGWAEFVVRHNEEGQLVGQWDDSGNERSEPLQPLIEREAMTVGEFSSRHAAIIGRVITTSIAAGDFNLPALRYLVSDAGTARYQWRDGPMTDEHERTVETVMF